MAAGALRHTPAPNNWYLFPYTVAGFLESVGRGDAETAAARQRALELLEGWYRGEGWYADGDGRAFDHYNGWALHLYPVLDAHLAGDTEASSRYGDRLRAHLEGYGLLFGADGAPVHFGRSLAYRFAASAAVGLGALTGHTPLTPGASRRLASGSMRHFLERGALTGDGLLSLGWHGPHPATLQSYSGPASPYWASKAFVSLLAPVNHPLWTAVEEPAPVEEADRVLALPVPGLLVQATREDGIVRLHNHGSDHVRPTRARRRTATTRTTGVSRTRPGPVRPPSATSRTTICRWRWPGGAAYAAVSTRSGRDTATAGLGGVLAPAGVRGRAAHGAGAAGGERDGGAGAVRAAGAPGDRGPAGARVAQTGWATGPGDPLVSALHGLHGWEDGAGTARAPQGTAFTRWAEVPRLTGRAGGTSVHVSLALLAAAPGPVPPAGAVSGVTAGDADAEVVWADGARTRVVFGEGST